MAVVDGISQVASSASCRLRHIWDGCWRQGLLDAADKFVDALDCRLVRVFEVGVFVDGCVRYYGYSVGLVIEDAHRVGDHEDCFWDVQSRWFVGDVRYSGLEVSDGIVCDVSDSAAVETWQPVNLGVSDWFESVCERVHWFGFAVRGTFTSLDDFARFSSDEGVS